MEVKRDCVHTGLRGCIMKKIIIEGEIIFKLQNSKSNHPKYLFTLFDKTHQFFCYLLKKTTAA